MLKNETLKGINGAITAKHTYIYATGYEDHIRMDFSVSDTGYIELYSNDETIIKPMSETEPYEKNIIVVYNICGDIIGFLDCPKIKLDNGNYIYGENIIEGSRIYQVFNDLDYELENTIASVSLYATMPYTYYFNDIGYNNGGAKHDFWMEPNTSAFYVDQTTNGSYLNSWNSLNNGMKTKMTGSDRTRWTNSVSSSNSLLWQYRCHYEFVSVSGYWNLEEYRTPSSYSQVVSSGCNP